ncbi:MAG: glycosyltransferase family 39 protein, partial [Myxococcales bacterium]|nr:glycosyltransferase family 39 protein [Myxococcales bacterium]
MPTPSSARVALTSTDLWASLVLAVAWVAIVRPGGLDLPFFWDEADVYVPGSVWVAAHDLDVTPGVFPDDYSRGHPPLLYLLAGLAFRAFGATPTVGHLLVLPFTVVALAGTYLLGAGLFDRRAGAAAALLLGVTPLFMSMGNMLLPEMPLTAL